MLRVRSLAETLGFYRDGLGLRVVASDTRRAELSADGDLPALIVLEEHAEARTRAGAESLMVNRLGMRVRQRSIPGSLFFGYDDYHHHVAANTWSTNLAAQPGSLGLASFTLRLTSQLLGTQSPGRTVLDRTIIHARQGYPAESRY